MTNVCDYFSYVFLLLLWKHRIRHRGSVYEIWSLYRYFYWLWLWGVPKQYFGFNPTQVCHQSWKEWKKCVLICIVIPLSPFKLTCLGLLNCSKWVNLLFLSICRLCLCSPEGYPAARTLVSLWKLALFPQQHLPMGDYSKIS